AQSLMPRESLEGIVKENFDLTASAGFLSERSYCLANVNSLLCLHMGPIPEEIKQWLLRPWLRRLSIAMTQRLCDLIIQLDAGESRERDVVLCYIGKSRVSSVTRSERWLRCVCGSGIDDEGRCDACGRRYEATDGMWFVLPDELKHVEANYDPKEAAAFP